MTNQESRTVHGSLTFNRLFIWIAVVLMMFAGITALGGVNLFGLGVSAVAWFFFSATAWLLAATGL